MIVRAAAIFLFLLVAAPAWAQFTGYSVPQTVQVKALNAVTCPTTFVLPNIGQNTHFLTYTTTGAPSNVRIQMEGSGDGVTFLPISQEATDGTQAGLYATGYYPITRVNCIAAIGGAAPTVTAFYSGTSAAGASSTGVFNRTPISRVTLFQGVTVSTNPSVTIATPFGNSSGYVLVGFSGAPPNAGCLLNVDNNVFASTVLFGIMDSLNFSGAGLVSPALFSILDSPAQSLRVRFLGCSSATTINAEYYFIPPNSTWGLPYQFTHINVNTNTNVKQTPAFLHSITVNTRGATANTATIFDGGSGAPCTGTVIGVIDTTVGTQTLLYDVFTFNGICITTATGTAADLTVSFR